MKRDTNQKGKFWLPQTPDHKVDGEFKLVNESEGQLTISGIIDPTTDRITYFNPTLPL